MCMVCMWRPKCAFLVFQVQDAAHCRAGNTPHSSLQLHAKRFSPWCRRTGRTSVQRWAMTLLRRSCYWSQEGRSVTRLSQATACWWSANRLHTLHWRGHPSEVQIKSQAAYQRINVNPLGLRPPVTARSFALPRNPRPPGSGQLADDLD